jgi:phosphotriesterase-related protein
MNNIGMKDLAQTVNGPIKKSELGFTLMHEHIFCDLRKPEKRNSLLNDQEEITIKNRFEVNYFQNKNQQNLILDEYEKAIEELKIYKEFGGETIVELSTNGINPEPNKLSKISQETGVNIILGTGCYTEDYLDEKTLNSSVEDLRILMSQHLHDGFDGTNICAGLIGELGCSWHLKETEKKTLHAALEIQDETGVTISIHPGRHRDSPQEIIKFLENFKVNPSKKIICHADRTLTNLEDILLIINKGYVLEWDFFGIETSNYWFGKFDLPTDYMRLDLIFELIKKGFENQITISHDICTRTRLSCYGGHGYSHINKHIVPLMLERGWSEKNIEQILVKNPANMLCYLN